MWQPCANKQAYWGHFSNSICSFLCFCCHSLVIFKIFWTFALLLYGDTCYGELESVTSDVTIANDHDTASSEDGLNFLAIKFFNWGRYFFLHIMFCTLKGRHYGLNITFIYPGKPIHLWLELLQFLLYCSGLEQTCSIAKVCLYLDLRVQETSWPLPQRENISIFVCQEYKQGVENKSTSQNI